MKEKHDMKLELARTKQDQIQKDLEDQQRRLLERQDKDMAQKIQKHDQIERQRIE